MTPENWKLVLAFGGLFLTTVTGPIVWAIVAESRRIRAEMSAMKSDLKLDMQTIKGELKLDVQTVKSDLKLEITAMEARLNQRIDTRLVHR